MALSQGAAIGIVVGCVVTINAFLLIVSAAKKRIPFMNADEAYLSARSAYGGLMLGASLAASCLGSWVLFAPPELSFLYGCLPIILYAVGVILPILFLLFAASKIRKATEHGFTLGDFILMRYGFTMHAMFLLSSALASTLSLAAELQFLGFGTQLLSPSTNRLYPIIIVASCTYIYTALGGLSASICSDGVQTVFILLLLIIGFIGASTELSFDASALQESATWTTEGLISGMTMILSFFPAYMIDQSAWQRIWAGKTLKTTQQGLMYACVFIAPVVILFGVGGLLARSLVTPLSITDSGTAYISLVLHNSNFFLGCTLSLIVMLVSSSMDSALSAISGLAAPFLKHFGLSYRLGSVINGAFLIFAIIIAVLWENSVLILLLIGNVFAAAITPPIFLGLHPAVPNFAAIFGTLCSLLSVAIVGLIHTKTFMGMLMAYTLPYELSSIVGLTTFITALLVSFLSTLLATIVAPYLFKRGDTDSNEKGLYIEAENHRNSNNSCTQGDTGEQDEMMKNVNVIEEDEQQHADVRESMRETELQAVQGA